MPFTSTTNPGLKPRVAIIGAGPIGLEAALAAHLAELPFTVFESGPVVASAVADWGHVVLFTPFATNRSAMAREFLLDQQPTHNLPLDDAFVTGREFLERYLLPLAQTPALASHIRTEQRVVAVGRVGCLKYDHSAADDRCGQPFQLLVEDQRKLAVDPTRERLFAADIVIDCSGVYRRHNWIGPGGMVAPGEKAAADRIDYDLPDITGVRRTDYAGRHIMLVGAGYSAATSIVDLARLTDEDESVHVYWLTGSMHHNPIDELEDDPMYARASLARDANAIAAGCHPRIVHLPGRRIERIERTDHKTLTVHARNDSDDHELIEVHRVVANVGYQPDRRLYEELRVRESPITLGPENVAAAIGRAGMLSVAGPAAPWDAEAVVQEEPNFYVLGAKSYGKDPHFLIETGLKQVAMVFRLIEEASAVSIHQ